MGSIKEYRDAIRLVRVKDDGRKQAEASSSLTVNRKITPKGVTEGLEAVGLSLLLG